MLDVYGMSLYLQVKIGTTNTSKFYSIKALLDNRAIGSFIDRDFIYSKGMNTWTISHPILIFNINGFSNKASQILKVIDVVLRYKTHSKRIFLVVSGLEKQSVILGYD